MQISLSNYSRLLSFINNYEKAEISFFYKVLTRAFSINHVFNGKILKSNAFSNLVIQVMAPLTRPMTSIPEASLVTSSSFILLKCDFNMPLLYAHLGKLK